VSTYHFRDAILWPKPLQKPRPLMIVGGGGKGLLRIAAKYTDYINLIPDSGKSGKVSLEKKLTDESFRSTIGFVHQEAKRHGRDPKAIKANNFVFIFVITNSKDETCKTAEMMAGRFGITPELMLQSPIALIGTPDECIAELRRREKTWGISQVILRKGMNSEEQLRCAYDLVLSKI
jgi:alkanesulfonate monooxygenase SsuD/methylene tetrahydromethanopterin reductase-like flavin-dependent oxidoreductase (luciferase family)